MARAIERQLAALEAHYRELLITELEQCAQGRWGLFGRNDAVIARMSPRERARHLDANVLEILELGEEIERRRNRLGITEPFALHQRLMHIRSTTNANTPGEPKLARQWLDEKDF